MSAPNSRIAFLRRQREWRAAAPAPHELRRDEFLLLGGLTILAEKVTKPSDMLL